MCICFFKAAFTLVYILIFYILLVNEEIYKWPYISKSKFTNTMDFFKKLNRSFQNIEKNVCLKI